MATWRHFGFQHTPFSTNPLEPVEIGPDAHTLFVGREAQLRRILDHVQGNGTGTRMVVEGPLGSGKTSLLTAAKLALAAETDDRGAYFVQVDHVRLRTDSTFESLAYQVVDSILATVRSPGFPHAVEKGTALAQALDLLVGGVDRQGGATAAGFGIQGGRSTVSPFLARRVDWVALLRGVAQDLVAFGYEGVVIHVNNLETLIEHDPGALQRLLHDARDLFQVPGCHFILVAPTGFTSNVLGAVDAARTIFPAVPVSVDLLSDQDFGTVVARRYDHAKRHDDYVPPVTVEVAQELYRLTGGSLRAAFQVIDTWVDLLDPVMARTAHHLGELVELLRPPFAAQVEQLPGREQEVLRAAASLGDPFRQKGIVAATGRQQSHVSELMSRLEEKRFLVFERQDGTSKWYRLDERALIAFWGLDRGPGGEEGEARRTP